MIPKETPAPGSRSRGQLSSADIIEGSFTAKGLGINSAGARSAPPDDITTFLGAIPAAEYEQRRRIRVCRNAANFKLRECKSSDARGLCWIVIERATEWLYTPADIEALTEIVRLCLRLLKVADQLEIIQAHYYE